MPNKNPPEWSRTPGDTTYVVALIDRTRLRAPVLMCGKDTFGLCGYTRSTARAAKFPTAKKAQNHLKKQHIEPMYLPIVLDIPKPRPRRPRPRPIHRWLPLPFPEGPEPEAPPLVEEKTPDGGEPPIETGPLLSETWPDHDPSEVKATPIPAAEEEPEPTPEQLAEQERQAREAPVLETVNEKILEYMRDYARNAKGKLLRHYCKIRAEVYEAHLRGEVKAPGKAARKPPQRTFDVFHRGDDDNAIYIGQMKARNIEEATRLAPEAYKGELRTGDGVRPIDPARLVVQLAAPDRPKEPKPMTSFDVFAWNPKGPREFIGTIEAEGRTSKENLKQIARQTFRAQLEGRADMEITFRPTPKTPAQRDKTYGRATEPPKPLRDVWLVIPLGQETPSHAVRGKTGAEALRTARARAEDSKFTLIPDDGRAASLELWITEPGKMCPQETTGRKPR